MILYLNDHSECEMKHNELLRLNDFLDVETSMEHCGACV